MCGICGELRLDGQVADLAHVGRMMARLERRGPDHEGSHSDGPLAFGHRRLSIIDLSNRSNQPLIDADLDLVLVFNGTIYNYKELRAELVTRGYHFFSEGDSETILKAYAEWGEDCVSHLHGMFAFAIWDAKRQQLFLGRDRFGIKPLYYSFARGCFRFASSTQAILAAGEVDTRIDPVALHHQFPLRGVVPTPRTLLRGIRKLAPGHTLMIEPNGRKGLRRYWSLQTRPTDHSLSEWDWVEAVRESLLRAVQRRMTVADVPVGVLLSGGLDSSLLVGLLAESGVEDLRTFSVGFEDHPDEKGSEFEYSDQVVERFQTRHHKFHVLNSEVLRRLPEAVDNMAEPMFGQDAVAFYLLAEQVSQHVKVVQSGQGADEVFGGYFWYPRMAADSGSDLERFAPHYFDRDHEEWLEMVGEGYQGPDYTAARVASGLDATGEGEFLNRVLAFDAATLIVDDPVKRVDNMTMAWGLEARVPFLDHELVERVASMPPEYKTGSGGKHILKRIARGLVPDGVIDRPKGYFPVPALKFVRGEFLDFMREVVNSRACRERGLYNTAYLDRLLADPEHQHTRLQGSKLWHLTLLEYWLQRNVEGISP